MQFGLIHPNRLPKNAEYHKSYQLDDQEYEVISYIEDGSKNTFLFDKSFLIKMHIIETNQHKLFVHYNDYRKLNYGFMAPYGIREFSMVDEMPMEIVYKVDTILLNPTYNNKLFAKPTSMD